MDKALVMKKLRETNKENGYKEPFKPSNLSTKHHQGTLGRYPEYVPSPKKAKKRKPENPNMRRKDSFRSTYKYKSMATPSVVLMNIRSKFK